MLARWMAIALLPLLAACASSVPHYRYYTLDMAPHAQAAAPIQLADVRIDVNEALSRPEIMVRTSPTSVEYYALDRWASGLDEQLAEKLKTEFASSAAGAPSVELDGVLMEFEQVDSGAAAEVRVKLDATLTVTRSGEKAAFAKLYVESQPAAAQSANAVVQALSRAVEAIATRIAGDVEAFVAAN